MMKLFKLIFVFALLALFGSVTAGKLQGTTDIVDPPPYFPGFHEPPQGTCVNDFGTILPCPP
uniref:Uncharacterized protein n=1 Tax=Anopheles minimus TaxID=112268 RepID=A0A182WN80_9DIPT